MKPRTFQGVKSGVSLGDYKLKIISMKTGFLQLKKGRLSISK